MDNNRHDDDELVSGYMALLSDLFNFTFDDFIMGEDDYVDDLDILGSIGGFINSILFN
jgi:hypothetical protein